jgi:hypothetical protein
MKQKTLFGILVFFISLVFLGAAEPSSETLVATPLGPPTAIVMTATPLPAPLDLQTEEPALGAGRAVVIPQLLGGLGRSGDPEKTLFDVNLVAMVALNVADYVSTREALKYPGLSESNPLMKPFVKSPAAFAAVKLGTTVLTYWSFKALFKKNRTMAWVLTTASNVVLSYIVANNIRMIHGAKAR